MLTFSEWDKLHYSIDESFKEEVHNWLDRAFGGKIDKIDRIISDLSEIESDFAKEWEKTQKEIFDLKGEIDSKDSTLGEEKKIKEKIKTLNSRLESRERLKIQKIRDLNIKVLSLTKGNNRIVKYWNLKKSEAEVEVAESLYNISKNFPDKKMEDDLYNKYLKSYENFKNREKQIEKVIPPEEKSSEEKSKDVSKDVTPDIQKLIQMNPSKFSLEVKKYSRNDIRKIQSALIEKKNSGLNELRSLRRTRSREADKVSPKERERVSQKYNPMIYELGEIIDGLREKISYLERWTN